MSWILFSILAAVCWATVNTVDKYVLTKLVRQPFVPIIILGLVGLIVAIIIYLIYGFSPFSYFNIFLAFLVGTSHILMTFFYFKAVQIEEISRVSPLFYLSPLFILILAAIFLGEVFTPLKYLGIFLLIIGAILISLRKPTEIRLGKAFRWMILSAFTLAVSQILTKHLLNLADFWTVFGYSRIGEAIGLIPVAYIYFPELINNIREHGKKVIAIISINEVINFSGVLFITFAVSIGYVTLVNALASAQQFFVLLFATSLSIFYPSILKEELSKSVVSLKILAIILMFTGAILIT